MLKASLIAASLAVALPAFDQEVRVINGDYEHVYGLGGQLLDDADLQARNQQRLQAKNQLALEKRQIDIEEERLKLQAAAVASGTAAQNFDPGMASEWDNGGWFIGSTRAFRPRFGISRRMGMIGHSPRAGISRMR